MGQYVKVPYSLLEANIKYQAKNVYIALMKFRSGENKKINVGLTKIAVAAGLKESQTSSYLTMLVDRKIITRQYVHYKNGHYGCNIYRIICDESNYAIIDWNIAYAKQLSAIELIAYCTLKKHTNLKKANGIVYMSNAELAQRLDCSKNHITKIKNELKRKKILDFKKGSKQITLL